MGVTSYLKGKAKEAIVNAKAEHEYAREQKLERREKYNKGYNEGIYKRGQVEGAGGITPATKATAPRQAGRNGGAARSPIKTSEDIFGGFRGGIGGGIAFGGFGEEPRQHAAPPVRTMKVSKSGAVTIHEPYQPKQLPQKQEDPYGTFWGAAESGPKKKGERHPYDIF
jgi:hypothetical protein